MQIGGRVVAAAGSPFDLPGVCRPRGEREPHSEVHDGRRPPKHVGIFLGGVVWHYSSKHNQVVREAPSLFALHQPSPDNGMFYGSLP